MSVRATDDAIAELRSRIGRDIRINASPYLTEASADAIRHWAEAIGDRNPLFTDPEHAARSRWGGLIAPPTILFAFDRQSIGYRGGLPGVHAFFAGCDWRFERPIRVGDRISAQVRFKDLVELSSRFAGRMFKQVSEITFRTTAGEKVAAGDSWGMRIERADASERTKYRALEPATYTRHQLEVVAARYRGEMVRGARPLWWEDVRDGDELPSIVRGPYTVTTAIAFEQGWGGLFIQTHGRWFEFLERHPDGGIANEQGIPEPPERVHWDVPFARTAGVPTAYDYGPERVSWLGTLVTNWAGDEGVLRQLSVEVRRFNLIGDLSTCEGRVLGKRIEGGEHQVDIELSVTDQRGEETAKGQATVVLPSRVPGKT